MLARGFQRGLAFGRPNSAAVVLNPSINIIKSQYINIIEIDYSKRRHASTSTMSNNKPRLNAVIVGAGPSGFYTAKYLSSAFSKLVTATGDECPSTESSFQFSGIDIDIVERLPTPYGLVRYGVAPDHPEVKNVENDFASVVESHSVAVSVASTDESDLPLCTMSYFGNVDVGRDISLQQLTSFYDIVVLAVRLWS